MSTIHEVNIPVAHLSREWPLSINLFTREQQQTFTPKFAWYCYIYWMVISVISILH